MIRATILALLLCACSGRWQFAEENDYFTALNNDNSYTQGVELSREHENQRVSMAQRIYTPASKRVSPAPPDQRPYAATIIAGVEQQTPWASDNTRGRLGIRGGVVGPWALGQEAQCGVHAILGQYCPAGWSDQVGNEPVASLSANVEQRGTSDLLGLYGIRLSRLEVEAGTLWSGIRSSSRWTWQAGPVYYFAGPGAQIVLRDVTLDGNTWGKSASIKKEWLVSELFMGLGGSYHGTGLEWFLSIKSPEFKGQGVYHYGGIRITWGK